MLWMHHQLSHEKKKRPYFPLNPGWLLAILIMAFYNPGIIGQYNPPYPTNHQGFNHLLNSWSLWKLPPLKTGHIIIKPHKNAEKSNLILKPSHMGVSKNRDTPKWMVYNGKPLLKWMIWRYDHFRKHPYVVWGFFLDWAHFGPKHLSLQSLIDPQGKKQLVKMFKRTNAATQETPLLEMENNKKLCPTVDCNLWVEQDMNFFPFRASSHLAKGMPWRVVVVKVTN